MYKSLFLIKLTFLKHEIRSTNEGESQSIRHGYNHAELRVICTIGQWGKLTV